MINPIVLDIEASGLKYTKCGIWQIGAIDLNCKNEFFFEEGRLDEEDIVEKKALEIVGKTEEELRDISKQSQKNLLENLFAWVATRPVKSILCQNPLFDFPMIEIKAEKYGLKSPIPYRCFNLHDLAQAKYKELHGEYLIADGKSQMGLAKILEVCGLEDKRKEHNALEDAKLTGECFWRLSYGQNLFPAYAPFQIPKEFEKK